MKHLSVVGKGYHTDEKVAGFYNVGDRSSYGDAGCFLGWSVRLVFWGLFMAVPVVGHVVVGGLSALGAALCSIGIPKDSVIQYETALKADSFLVMARGTQRKWLAPRRSWVPPTPRALLCIRA